MTASFVKFVEISICQRQQMRLGLKRLKMNFASKMAQPIVLQEICANAELIRLKP